MGAVAGLPFAMGGRMLGGLFNKRRPNLGERISSVLMGAVEQWPKETAAAEPQLSEAARREKRRKASMLTKDWSRAKLAPGGVLGAQ